MTLALLAMMAVPTMARAQSPQEIALARETARDGLEAYQAGEYDKALSLFSQARTVYPSAQILRMTGYTLLALGEHLRASEAMETALDSRIGALSEGDRGDVEKQLAQAYARIGRIDVASRFTGAELTVDGGSAQALPLPRPLRLAPGKHLLVRTAPGEAEARREVAVQAGESLSVDLDPPLPAPAKAEPPPAPPPPAPPPPAGRAPWFAGQRVAGFVLVGVGVATGAAAAITALAGASLRDDVEEDIARHQEAFGDACQRNDPRQCLFDRAVINQDADRADTVRDTSVWLGVGAGVLAAGGATLLFFYPWGNAGRDTAAAPPLHCAAAYPAALSCRGAF
ncbi:MAG: hypothetical protein WKG00_09565 [Polyangiaceae bacterium]